MKSIWNDEEVKELFDTVERTKAENKPLKNAFQIHAQKFSRKPNSVRNYYYHEIDNLSADETRCKRIGINLCQHTKSKLVPFSKEQEQEFLENIKSLTGQGMSVRAACFKLGNGDMTLVTRLQNKYQNLKNQEEVPNNIISFRDRKKLLTDGDINSLFMGLVKLVKKNAAEDAYDRIKEEKASFDATLKEAYAEINKKDRELSKAKGDILSLKAENVKLQKKLAELGYTKQEKLRKLLAQSSDIMGAKN